MAYSVHPHVCPEVHHEGYHVGGEAAELRGEHCDEARPMGLSVAFPATGVIDSFEVRSPSTTSFAFSPFLYLVAIKCRATAEQGGVQRGRQVRGHDACDNDKRRRSFDDETPT